MDGFKIVCIINRGSVTRIFYDRKLKIICGFVVDYNQIARRIEMIIVTTLFYWVTICTFGDSRNILKYICLY